MSSFLLSTQTFVLQVSSTVFRSLLDFPFLDFSIFCFFLIWLFDLVVIIYTVTRHQHEHDGSRASGDEQRCPPATLSGAQSAVASCDANHERRRPADEQPALRLTDQPGVVARHATNAARWCDTAGQRV